MASTLNQTQTLSPVALTVSGDSRMERDFKSHKREFEVALKQLLTEGRFSGHFGVVIKTRMDGRLHVQGLSIGSARENMRQVEVRWQAKKSADRFILCVGCPKGMTAPEFYIKLNDAYELLAQASSKKAEPKTPASNTDAKVINHPAKERAVALEELVSPAMQKLRTLSTELNWVAKADCLDALDSLTEHAELLFDKLVNDQHLMPLQASDTTFVIAPKWVASSNPPVEAPLPVEVTPAVVETAPIQSVGVVQAASRPTLDLVAQLAIVDAIVKRAEKVRTEVATASYAIDELENQILTLMEQVEELKKTRQQALDFLEGSELKHAQETLTQVQIVLTPAK